MFKRLFWVVYVLWVILVLYNENTRETGPHLGIMLALIVPPPIVFRLLQFIVRGR
jgi:hypothetical protein